MPKEELPEQVLEPPGDERGVAEGAVETVEEGEAEMTNKPKLKSVVIVQLLLTEMTAMRKEMVRLRKMLRDLVG